MAVTTNSISVAQSGQRPLWWRRVGSAPWSVIVLALVCTAAFLGPVITVGIGAFRTGLPGTPLVTWTSERFTSVITSASTYKTMRTSAVAAALVTVAATSLATYFSWVVARSNAPLRRFVAPLMLVVLATPSMFFAISWDMLGNARVGVINKALRALVDSEARSGPLDIYSWWGLVFVSTIKITSLAFFLIVGPFTSMDRSLEEASTVAGASRFTTFLRVHLPVLSPAIVGTSIVIFVVMLESFDIPQVIGTPAGIRVFATEIYALLNQAVGADFAGASALSLMLVVIILALARVQTKLLGDRQFTTISGKSYRTDRWELGPSRWIITVSIVIYAVLAVFAPLWQIAVGSMQPYFGVTGRTLDNYRVLFDDSTFVSALRDTVIISIVGGFVAMLAALWICWTIKTRPGWMSRYISMTHWAIVAVPGIVLGLGIFWLAVWVPFLKPLYGSIWLLLGALLVSAIPLAIRAASGAVAQVPVYLQEAALVSGSSRGKAFRTVIGPLMAPSFVYGWTLTAIVISGNLAVPMLLVSPRANVLASRVLQAYREGEYAIAGAIFGTMLVAWAVVSLVGAVLFLIAKRLAARARTRGAAPAEALHLSTN